MKHKNIFWPVLLLLASVFIIVNQLGYFQGISIPKILFSVVLIGFFLSGLVHLEFGSILFSAAIFCIMYSSELHLEAITPWPVLAAALLATIALNMLFGKHKHNHNRKHNLDSDQKYDSIIDEQDSNEVTCYAHMGSVVKYVNTDSLTSAYVDCTFGGAKVYFDHATIAGDSAVLDIHLSFGGAEIYIPKEWNVVCNADSFCGGIEEKGRRGSGTTPTFTITGNIKFGGLTIYYI